MTKYLLDTNILIYYLNGTIPDENTRIDTILQSSFHISILTKIEFLSWGEFLEKNDELAKAQEFIGHATMLNLDNAIVQKTIELRREFKIPLADSVIAATALENEMTVVTRNVADFQMTAVDIYNPFSESATIE